MLICATGYDEGIQEDLLAPKLKSHLQFDQNGHLSVRTDHSVELSPGSKAKIYSQTLNAVAGGLSSTLLSNLAVRAGIIEQSARKHLILTSQVNASTRELPEDEKCSQPQRSLNY